MMNKAIIKSLPSLLGQAQESTAETLKQFEQRLRAAAARPSETVDATAHHWMLELAAARARVQVRDIQRRFLHTVSTLQLSNAISDGEAASVQQAMERLLGAALNEIERHLGKTKAGK